MKLVSYVRKLLTVSRVETGFETKYHKIIRQYPIAAISHAAVMQLLRRMGNK
ncbi:MAG: hypothetical protein M1383_05115 [Patescibacteria group bacterium]|nr:hypothetical protein [Patescibacteria group bacterium]